MSVGVQSVCDPFAVVVSGPLVPASVPAADVVLAGAPYPDAAAGVVSAAPVVRGFELHAASATAPAIAVASVPARSAVRFMMFLLRFGTRPDQHARHAAGARVLPLSPCAGIMPIAPCAADSAPALAYVHRGWMPM